VTEALRTMRGEWLLEYFRYRELFYFLVWRDVKIRYKQTVLGAAWAVIQPFFMMIVFTLFFGRMAGIDSEGVPYPVFSYSALVPWTYFQQAMPLSGNSLLANSRLISKVYFPRAIIPAAAALGGVVDFFIAAVVLVAIMLYYGFPLGWGLLLWPVLLVPTVAFVVAVGMIFSALNVKYRDIKYTIPFFIQAMLFVSPVIYPTSAVPEQYQTLLRLNPMVGLINAFRAAALPGRTIDLGELGVSIAVITGLLIVATIYFRKTERAFADLI